MSTKATLEAIGILKECIDELQSEKGTILAGVQKLGHAANILGEQDIAIWCEIQFGNSKYTLPLSKFLSAVEQHSKENNEKSKSVVSETKKTLNDLGLKQDIHYTIDEIMVKRLSSSGGYGNIGFIESKYKELNRQKVGNDGTYYVSNLLQNMNYIKSIAYKYATELYNKYQFADTPQTIIDILKNEIDDKLLDLEPTLAEKLMLAFKAVTSNSQEELSQALTTCRRFIESLADALYPATDEKINGRILGKQNYINRLWAFMDKAIESESNKEMAKAHIDYLGSWLQRIHKVSNKGVHTDLDRLEAIKAVLHTYLMVGDILSYLNLNTETPKKVINIHTATLDELQSFLDVSKNLAKEIIKLRVQKGKLIPKDLLDIKGIGKKTIGKAEEIFSFELE